jgi:maleylpyruvate isomerase
VPPADVQRRLAAVRASTDRFVDALGQVRWDEQAVRAPSMLPGWARAHVLTHLARNADAIAGMLRGVLLRKPTPMYPRGDAGRDADIEAGAAREAQAILADVMTATSRLDEVWSEMTDDAWDATVRTRSREVAAWRTLGMRWREVEIHWVDLDIGYRPSDWPAAFVAPLLPSLANPTELAPRLPAGVSVDIEVTDTGQLLSVTHGPERVTVRGPSWAVVGWLLGRPAAIKEEIIDPPVLTPWL